MGVPNVVGWETGLLANSQVLKSQISLSYHTKLFIRSEIYSLLMLLGGTMIMNKLDFKGKPIDELILGTICLHGILKNLVYRNSWSSATEELYIKEARECKI